MQNEELSGKYSRNSWSLTWNQYVDRIPILPKRSELVRTIYVDAEDYIANYSSKNASANIEEKINKKPERRKKKKEEKKKKIMVYPPVC